MSECSHLLAALRRLSSDFASNHSTSDNSIKQKHHISTLDNDIRGVSKCMQLSKINKPKRIVEILLPLLVILNVLLIIIHYSKRNQKMKMKLKKIQKLQTLQTHAKTTHPVSDASVVLLDPKKRK
uniref:Uncharacterized protein n=1 Tax=Rhizophagus irregularis (strain DAOM 181602 / DAOM 197198 / MUCL 43194) TaxID=747089 RepID=U9UBC6_RHIID